MEQYIDIIYTKDDFELRVQYHVDEGTDIDLLMSNLSFARVTSKGVMLMGDDEHVRPSLSKCVYVINDEVLRPAVNKLRRTHQVFYRQLVSVYNPSNDDQQFIFECTAYTLRYLHEPVYAI